MADQAVIGGLEVKFSHQTVEQGGPWHVAFWNSPDPKFWWIVNENTHTWKRIGKVSKGRGVNYYDRAVEEAARRNDNLKGAQK